MPFIGKNPTAGFATIVKDDFTPNGTDTQFTLSKQVASPTDIAVFVGNVRQEPTTAYTVNGTTLDFGSGNAPANGLDMYVLHIGGTQETSIVPADGTISSAKIVSNAITSAKLDTNIAVSGTFGVTGLITAGAGVSIGSGGNSNTLDDFEEGTFQAVRRTFQNGAAAWYGNEANLTNMSAVTSRYTKIGKIVHFYIPRQNVPTDNCALYRITGLPFTALNDTNGDGTARFPVYYEEHRGFHGKYNSSTHTSNFQFFYYTYGNSTEIIPGATLENSDGSLYPFASTSSGSAFPAVIGMYETAS